MKYNVMNSFYTIFFMCHIGLSQSPELLFERGNQLYNDGEFELAIMEFNKILENNLHSSELYFNMGNSYYKLNDIANSNFYFEKSLLLSPNDIGILKNLSFAKNMILDDIEELPKTQFQNNINYLVSLFSIRVWSFILISLMLSFFISSILYLFSNNPIYKRAYFSLSFFLIIISFLTSNLIWKESKKINEQKNGIIFSKELSVFSEPNLRDEEIFTLHEGTKVELMDKLKGWNKIRLRNGSEGWVVENNIKPL